MSTRSLIASQTENGYEAIYCLDQVLRTDKRADQCIYRENEA